MPVALRNVGALWGVPRMGFVSITLIIIFFLAMLCSPQPEAGSRGERGKPFLLLKERRQWG